MGAPRSDFDGSTPPLNRDVLGWNVAPPIVLLRIQDRLVAFPSNASMGEFGFAVQLDLSPRILGVATW